MPILYGNLSTFVFQTLPVSFDILTRVILILWVVLNLCSVTSNILHEVLLSQAKRENLHLDKIIFVNILSLSHVHRHKLNEYINERRRRFFLIALRVGLEHCKK